MKAFNLEDALAGKPLVTRDGIKATQFHHFDSKDDLPFYAVIDGSVESFNCDGRFFGKSNISRYDLFMAMEKKVGWVNLYRVASPVKDWVRAATVYATETEARKRIELDNTHYITTVQVEWEE